LVFGLTPTLDRPPSELARRVTVGKQSLKFTVVGGAKITADVGAPHLPNMPRQSKFEDPVSGAEQ